jgi:ABC-type Fe3+ transport system permease subunit
VNIALYSRWIGERLDILSSDLKEAASLIGMGRLAFLTKIELNFLKPIIARIALYSFLIALGDLSFSMLLADKTILLAPLARLSVQRYDFSLGPALIWIGFIATFFYFLSIKIFPLIWRFKK